MGWAAESAHSRSESRSRGEVQKRLILLPSPQKRSRILEFILVLIVYLLAGEMGLAVPFTSGNVSPLWPPAGVAFAALLSFGNRVWPAITLGALLVNFFSPIPHLAAVGIAGGNTLGAVVSASLVRRFPNFRLSLTRTKDVILLSVFGAVVGPAISATIGVAALFGNGVNAWAHIPSAWRIWLLGDAMGVLIVAPLALTFSKLIETRASHRAAEFAVLLVGTTFCSLLIFEPVFWMLPSDIFAFAILPFVLWGAIRFEACGATVTSFLISFIAVWGTARGVGPFTKGNPLQNATLLQSFLMIVAVSGLTLAAAIAENSQLIRDQTESESIAKNERQYRIIVETAYEGIWKIDANLRTTFVNQRMAELLGYTADEMIGKPLFDFLFERDIEEKHSDLERRSQGICEQIERRFRKKDGSVLWARMTNSPLIGEHGEMAGALAMVSDMTEEKLRAEERCRTLETITLLSQAVEQTADSVLITDRDGNIEYVNPAFEKTTEYSRDEAVGATPRILKSGIHDTEFYSRLWDQVLRGNPYRGTLVNRSKSGRLYWTEQTIAPIRDVAGDITHFVSVLKDITELRRRQEQEVQLRLARDVQQKFYTGASVSVAGFDIATAAYPAEETGGDYLDLFSMQDGRICIGIGDVSGHGLDSALLMALTRAYVRSFIQVETDLGQVLCRVNQMLAKDLQEGRYVTLLLTCLDHLNGTLAYAGAGHIPGIILDDSGEIVSMLDSSGPPLGLFAGSAFQSDFVELRSGEVVLLLTDGATETTTAEDVQFGTEGVVDFVRHNRLRSARDLAEGIYTAARAFAEDEPQHDDVTDVIIKVT